MNRERIAYWINEMKAQGWHLAIHTTILDRRNSFHRRIGKLQFIKPIRARRGT